MPMEIPKGGNYFFYKLVIKDGEMIICCTAKSWGKVSSEVFYLILIFFFKINPPRHSTTLGSMNPVVILSLSLS